MQSIKTTPKSVRKQATPETPPGLTAEQAVKVFEILKANYQLLEDINGEARTGPYGWYKGFYQNDDYLNLTVDQRIKAFAMKERLFRFCYDMTDLKIFPLER